MSLAHAQQTVLQAIATQSTQQPTARDYLSTFRIVASTMAHSLELLMDNDFVRVTEQGSYEMIDPLTKGILAGTNVTS